MARSEIQSDESSQDARTEAQVFATLKAEAEARAAEDARDRVVLATPKGSRLRTWLRSLWRDPRS